MLCTLYIFYEKIFESLKVHCFIPIKLLTNVKRLGMADQMTSIFTNIIKNAVNLISLFACRKIFIDTRLLSRGEKCRILTG